MMTADFTIGSHAIGYPANVASQRYGNHMPSVKLSTDTDNGNLIAVGAWKAWDYFEEAAVTTFTGKIIAQNPDGTFLVLVTDPGDAVFVYTKPLTPYESPAALKQEKAFFNKAGDIARTYVLTKFDRIAISAEGFDGTPVVGKNITGVSAKKLTVGA
jgi:hypothetical protein